MGFHLPKIITDIRPIQWNILQVLESKGSLTRLGIIQSIIEQMGRELKKTTIHDNVVPLVLIGIIHRERGQGYFRGRPSIFYELNVENGFGKDFTLREFVETQIRKFWEEKPPNHQSVSI